MALRYLLRWARRLHGRSGFTVGLGGALQAPLSFATILAWSQLMRIDPTPEEVDALIELDTAMLSPGVDEDTAASADDDSGT